MNRSEEWNSILNSLFNCARDRYRTSREYAYIKVVQRETGELLNSILTEGDREIVSIMLEEFNQAAEHEAKLLYQQGMEDCMWMLKNLGLFSTN